jgi:class 3 adenylate cyclase
MGDNQQQHYLLCLALADEFDSYWNFYQQCRGQEFGPQCHDSAVAFFGAFDSLPELLRGDMDATAFASMAQEMHLEESVGILRQWLTVSNGAVLSGGHAVSSLAGIRIQGFFGLLRSRLFTELGVRRAVPNTVFDRFKVGRYLEWMGHLPKLNHPYDPLDLMLKVGQSPSIVVVGDIRRSQELMTYATSPIEFPARMYEFLSKTRALVANYGGIFDKFTGDGFVAYFNDEIGNRHRSNCNDSFVGFVREYMAFADSHFGEWSKHLKKLPREKVGVAIGADLGLVSFQNFDLHLVAVGEAIVWAARMEAEAKAGEIIVNNILYESLRQRSDVTFEKRRSRTKSGEGFSAWAMLLGDCD